MSLRIEENAVVLFQGDSITDAGRAFLGEGGLGQGYAMMAASLLTALVPERRIRFINRGISGNGVDDLRARWQEDCLDLAPSWVSILIGVNDVWRRWEMGGGDVDAFEADYRWLLERVRDELGARPILLEPFLLPSSPSYAELREGLHAEIRVVRGLAEEFHAILVPLDGIFERLCSVRSPGFWAADGVHPSPGGHAVIALAWLEAVGAMPT